MKSLSVLMLVLILFSLLSIVYNIQPAKAFGTIYIRADGSIEPPDAPISTADNITYTLTADVISDVDGIVVERNDAVIDCDGYMLQGTVDGTGIDISERENVTVRNAQIRNFNVGILLLSSFNNSISENNITNSGIGIKLYASNNNSISRNNVANNNQGILLWPSSNDNCIIGNNITANQHSDIFLEGSSSNSIGRNNITNSDRGIWIHIDCTNNSVSGNNIANNGYSVWLVDCSNMSISANNITNNYRGIMLGLCSNNSISGNNITNSGIWGIKFWESSNYNVVSGNNIVASSNWGIYFDASSGNSVYHNDFIGNSIQTYSSGSVNFWDNGYPSGGNYWSDYAGVDVKSGPSQDQSGSDGIGDVPCVIGADNEDNYPLMELFTPRPWDIDRDEYIDAKDAVLLGMHFGAHIGSLDYLRVADINLDGYVNAKDAVILGMHFGEKYI